MPTNHHWNYINKYFSLPQVKEYLSLMARNDLSNRADFFYHRYQLFATISRWQNCQKYGFSLGSMLWILSWKKNVVYLKFHGSKICVKLRIFIPSKVSTFPSQQNLIGGVTVGSCNILITIKTWITKRIVHAYTDFGTDWWIQRFFHYWYYSDHWSWQKSVFLVVKSWYL